MSYDSQNETLETLPGQRLRTMLIIALLAVPVLAIVLYVAQRMLSPLLRMDVVQVFSLSMLSIIFEALPFVLAGALLSGLIEVFVPAPTLLRMVPRSRLGQLAAGAAAGVALPVCECGIIIVLRRLLRKGMPLPMALAYLLAAPIVNPVVG